REQIVAAGLREFMQPDGVTVIEWAERLENGGWKPADGKNFARVKLEILGETDRKIVYDDPGP
ncbi:MAG: hypothetical protein KGJ60_12345, partial [Verrucomicrobiota bacterium]|nr:hypothetical protein [Verrucomicrobiota bacterium]